MLTRPPLVPVYAGVLLALVVIGLLVSPDPFWGVFAPTPAAAFRLREARVVSRFDGCGMQNLGDWHRLVRDRHAASWFTAVTREALRPAGRVYGLAGLHAVAPAVFDSAIAQLEPGALDTLVPVLDSNRVVELPVRELVPQIRHDVFARLWADAEKRPEC